MDPATTSLLVLAAVVVLFVWNRLPVASVAVLTALTLWATGLLDYDQVLAGFGDPVVVFIASLFVVSEAIDSAGVTNWAGQTLLARIGARPKVALVAIMMLAAVMSALITLNGAAAALLPMVVVIAMRLGVAPAHMLLPMAFAGSSGSLLILTASPINVLVSDASSDAGAGGFGFFEFSVVGIPLVLGTLAIGALLAEKVLPVRESLLLPPDLSRYASTVQDHYDLTDGFHRLHVREHSPLVGTAAEGLDLAEYAGVTVTAVQASDGAVRTGSLEASDVLVVTGPSDAVSRLAMDQVLTVAMRPVTDSTGALITDEMGVAELVVPPRSPLVGESVFAGQLRSSDVVILAIRRRGKDLGAGPVDLVEGDLLLVHGAWSAVDSLVDHRDVVVVNSPDLVRRQAAPLGSRAWRAIAVLAVMILLLALGLVPASIAGLGAALAMVLLRVISGPQALRSISWQTVVLIGGLIPLSTAIRTSGAADVLASWLLSVVGDAGPIVLLFALFVMTATLGQFISNTATVLILLPVAVAAATEFGVSVQPVLMTLAIAGACSFLTPVATPANMMVMGPGGYRFNDYWRLGLPVLLWWLVVALVVVPLVWHF
jgi:di/tricarboxylate transporter